MDYRIERHRGSERNSITIHLNVDLRSFRPKPAEGWRPDSDTTFYDDDDEQNPPNFLKRLRYREGVDEVEFSRYRIYVTKGEFFKWEKILPTIIKDLETVLNNCRRFVKHRRKSSKALRKRIEAETG